MRLRKFTRFQICGRKMHKWLHKFLGIKSPSRVFKGADIDYEELKASRKHDFVLNQLYTKVYGHGSAYYFTCTICGETIRQSKKDFWSLEKTYVRTVDCKPR